MRKKYQGFFKGERALFRGADLKIYDSIYDDGELPLICDRTEDKKTSRGKKALQGLIRSSDLS